MRARIELLASPVFVGSVIVLAVNDHLLKNLAPGFVTGKLSDFAGLFVVTVLLGVLTQSRVLAVVSGGLGFVALKTIPIVAIAAAPILGGRTLLDSSDLVALLVLAPAWWWLGRHQSVRQGEARAVLGVLGALVAMTTVTATSCALPDQVEHLARTRDGSLIAIVRNDYQEHRAVSSDGRTWAPTRAAGGAFVDGQSACLADGSCFRVVPGRRVESLAPNGTWRTVFAYTAEQRRRRSLRVEECGGSVPTFASLGIVGTGREQHVVVVMGPDGVLWRASDGRWQRRAVLGVEPTRLDGSSWLRFLSILPLVVAGLLAIALFAVRLRTRRWNRSLATAILGIVGVLMIAGALAMSAVDYTVSGPLIAVLTIAVLPVAAVAARLIPSRPPILGAGGLPLAGWHPDPYGGDQLRWWDGRAWSHWTQPRH